MKKLIVSLFFIMALMVNAAEENEKIKLYAMYTPSHTVLVEEWFLPSLKDDYEVIIDFHKQECPTGSFMQEGWTKTTIRKIDLLIRAVYENWGKIFIYSDVDIQFFRSTKDIILNLIKDKDLVIQRDSSDRSVCSGFFACRANEKTLKLWQRIRKYMQSNLRISDQPSLNRFIRITNPYNVVWNYLPVEFFGGGTLTGKGWKIGDKLQVPQNIILHHANFTVGIENKIAQLQYVRGVVASR